MLGGISPNSIGIEPTLPMDEVPLAPGEVAPGVIATGTDPLPYIPAPSITVPAQVDVSIAPVSPAGTPTVSGSGGFSIGKLSSGRASIDLHDGYWLWLNEYQSEVMIENRTAAVETTIWGAGQVAVNGQEAGQFYGTTSFELANGAKITIETGHDLADQCYYLDKLTVTKEERAVIITGIDDDVTGDLNLSQSNDGYRIDDNTRDGFVLEEQVHTAPAPAPIAPTPVASGPIMPVDASVPAAEIPTQVAAEAIVPVEPVIAAEAIIPASIVVPNAQPVSDPISAPDAPLAVEIATITEATAAVVVPPSAEPVAEPVAQTAIAPVQAPVDPVPVAETIAPEALATVLPDSPAASHVTPPMEIPIPISGVEVPNTAAASVAPEPAPVAPPKIVGGWASEWGDVLTTKLLQQETGVGADYGPDSQLMSLGEINTFISSYIVFGHISSLWSLYEMNNSTYSSEDIYNERTLPRLPELEQWLIANPGAQFNRAIEF